MPTIGIQSHINIFYVLIDLIKSPQKDHSSDFCVSSPLLFQGPDSDLPAVCGPAVDRHGQRPRPQAETHT